MHEIGTNEAEKLLAENSKNIIRVLQRKEGHQEIADRIAENLLSVAKWSDQEETQRQHADRAEQSRQVQASRDRSHREVAAQHCATDIQAQIGGHFQRLQIRFTNFLESVVASAISNPHQHPDPDSPSTRRGWARHRLPTIRRR